MANESWLKLIAAGSLLRQLPILMLIVITSIINSNAYATTSSIYVTNGAVLTYTETARAIKNVGCSDIPTLIMYTYGSFSYSGAQITNPTAVATFEFTGCQNSNLIDIPATLNLSNGCTILVNPSQGGVPSASLSCPNVSIHPKYVIVGVTYAPPGPSSYVQYTQSNLFGTTISDSQTYSAQTSLTTTASAGSLPGWISGKLQVSAGSSATQTRTSSNATTLSFTNLSSYKVMGPPSPPVSINTPINHNYDVIWLWLNPVAMYSVATNYVQFNGFAYNEADLAGVDIYPVLVGQLNGSIPMDPSLVQELSRSWASVQTFPAGDGPGLTLADFANILASDPFTNSAYSVSPSATTSGDKRFTLTGSTSVNGGAPAQSFIYAPGTVTETYSNTYVNSTLASSGVTNQTAQTYGVDFTVTATTQYGIYSLDLKTSNTQTWTYQQSKSLTNTSTQIDLLSLGTPCASCAYTGPTVFEVYQDNIFGTFMFNPVR